MIDSIRRNVKRYPEAILNIVNTDDRRTVEDFGLSRRVCINGKPVIKRLPTWKGIRTEIQNFC